MKNNFDEIFEIEEIDGTLILKECIDKRIKEAIIPDGIEVISNRAFKECSQLKSIVIPESVREIEHNAFLVGPSLEAIYVPGSFPDDFRDDAHYYGCYDYVIIKRRNQPLTYMPDSLADYLCGDEYDNIPFEEQVKIIEKYTRIPSKKYSDFKEWWDKISNALGDLDDISQDNFLMECSGEELVDDYYDLDEELEESDEEDEL